MKTIILSKKIISELKKNKITLNLIIKNKE